MATFAKHFMLLPSLAVAAITFLQTYDLIGWRYGLWKDTTAIFHGSLQLTGPLIAGVTAWFVIRTSSRNMLISSAWNVRSGLLLSLLQLQTAYYLLGAAWLVGLMPIVFQTARTATYGTLLPVTVLYAAAGVLLYVAVGFFAGRVLPLFITPPATAIAAFFLASSLATKEEALALVSPVRFRRYSLDVMPSKAVEFYLIATYILLAGALVAAGTLWSRRPIALPLGGLLRLPIRMLALTSIPALALIALVNFWRPDQYLPADRPTPVCDTVNQYPVCVHPALRTDLTATVNAATAVLDVYGPQLPRSVSRLVSAGDGIDLGEQDLTFVVRPRLDVDLYVGEALISDLTGREACYEKYGLPRDEGPLLVQEAQVDVADAVSAWMGESLSLSSYITYTNASAIVLDRLNSLPRADVTRWIQEHREQLWTCDMLATDVP